MIALALHAIAFAHVDSVTPLVAPFAASADAEVRAAAASALASSTDAPALRLLVALSRDLRREVRNAAIVAYLASAGADPSVATRLAGVYEPLPGDLNGSLASAATDAALARLERLPIEELRSVVHGLPRPATPSVRSWIRGRLAREAPFAATSVAADEYTLAGELLGVLVPAAEPADAAAARRFLHSASHAERRAAAELLEDAAVFEEQLSDWRTQLGETLKTCTGCHAVWKQRVVDEGEWEKATASAAPAMMHQGP